MIGQEKDSYQDSSGVVTDKGSGYGHGYTPINNGAVVGGTVEAATFIQPAPPPLGTKHEDIKKLRDRSYWQRVGLMALGFVLLVLIGKEVYDWELKQDRAQLEAHHTNKEAEYLNEIELLNKEHRNITKVNEAKITSLQLELQKWQSQVGALEKECLSKEEVIKRQDDHITTLLAEINKRESVIGNLTLEINNNNTNNGNSFGGSLMSLVWSGINIILGRWLK